MKKFKLSESNINLLMAIAGVAIFLVAYLLGYRNLTVSNEELDTQIAERTEYKKQLDYYLDNINTYKSGVAEAEATINKCLSRLPVDIKPEDYLLYCLDLYNKNNLYLTSVNAGGANLVGTYTTMIDGSQRELTGYSTSTSLNAQMSYAQLKLFIGDIYDENSTVTFIDNISLSKAGDNGLLNVNFTITKYYATYEGAVYEPVPSKTVNIGSRNPFG